MPKRQSRAGQRARDAARDGAKYTAALRTEIGQPSSAGAALTAAISGIHAAVQELPDAASVRQIPEVAAALQPVGDNDQAEAGELAALVKALRAVPTHGDLTSEEWKLWHAARELQVAFRYPEELPPGRLVDDHANGWVSQGWSEEHDDELFMKDYAGGWSGSDGGAFLPYMQVVELYGPVRPVVAMPEEDADRLVAEMTRAGRKALISVLVALYRLWADDLAAHRGQDRGHILTAGRGGSWEADTFRRVVHILGFQVGERRLDERLVDSVVEVVSRWLYNPDGYVELAEGFASLFAEVADAYEGDRHGMQIIADQWVMRHEGLETLENWALSLSRRHGPHRW
ncbi:hypothetical protein ACFWYW_46945 [Nonomuraea sp. NPDC059023]|uniref:hypothetical protein n=1 Tax=unclassified Nonomuraea TaxID=2593643 RepID=UPI00367858DD